MSAKEALKKVPEYTIRSAAVPVGKEILEKTGFSKQHASVLGEALGHAVVDSYIEYKQSPKPSAPSSPYEKGQGQGINKNHYSFFKEPRAQQPHMAMDIGILSDLSVEKFTI